MKFLITKVFHKGHFEGMEITEKMTFVNSDYANDWMNGINTKTDLDYRVSSVKLL